MAFQPVPNTAECVLEYAQSADGVVIGRNVLHFTHEDPGVWDATTIQGLAEGALEFWLEDIKPVTSSGVALSRIAAKNLEIEAGEVYDIGMAESGALAGAALPANVTLAIGKKTGAAGPGRRGRIFHMGLTEAQVTNSRLVAGVGADIISAWADFFANMSAAGFIHVLVSRYLDGVERVSGASFIVTDLSLFDSRVDTQKRRLRNK